MESEIFRTLLKHVSKHLSVLFQFAWLYFNGRYFHQRKHFSPTFFHWIGESSVFNAGPFFYIFSLKITNEKTCCCALRKLSPALDNWRERAGGKLRFLAKKNYEIYLKNFSPTICEIWLKYQTPAAFRPTSTII